MRPPLMRDTHADCNHQAAGSSPAVGANKFKGLQRFRCGPLSTDADIYILDEPTAGVDPEYAVYMWRSLEALREKGTSVLFSTHHVSEIGGNCDYFYFLKDGITHRFKDATEFIGLTGAGSLDEAFVRYVIGN